MTQALQNFIDILEARVVEDECELVMCKLADEYHKYFPKFLRLEENILDQRVRIVSQELEGRISYYEEILSDLKLELILEKRNNNE